jgi:hypothetical protein
MAIIYLHVGPHKTGSTYLQSEFAKQAKSLASQDIIYPSVGREYALGHHNIAWYFAGRPLLKTNLNELLNGFAFLRDETRNDLLLSSEEFARIPRQNLANLRHSFPDHHFHILYFRRKGTGLAVSLWQEMVKHGFSLPMDQVTLTDMAEFFNYNPFEHDENISRFETQLNGKALVFDYNTLLAEKQDILSVVCSSLDVKLRLDNQIVNPSLTFDVIELIRAANLYSRSLGKPRGGFPRKMCLAMLRKPIGLAFKSYLANKTAKLSKSIFPEDFLDNGFPPSNLVTSDAAHQYPFVPGDLLLEMLNKDDRLAWRRLKDRIKNWKT